MPGPSSITSSLVVALTIFATHVRPAEAFPAWLGYVALPVAEADGEPDPHTAPTGEPADISNHELCHALVASASERGLPVSFFTNLIWQESRFKTEAVSPAGAEGIAQFMPAVSRTMGFDPYDPRQAIPAAAELLRTLLDRFGNLGLAAAAYNAGPKRIVDWLAKRAPLPAETRNYVVTITGQKADDWRSRKASANAFTVPARVPCHQVAAFAAVARIEQAQAETEAAAIAAAAPIKPSGSRTRLAAARKKATPRVALQLRDKAKKARPASVRAAAQRKSDKAS